MSGRIVVVTGPPAAGKTTLARLLAPGAELGVHLHADDFWSFVVGGYVDPWLAGSHHPQDARRVRALGARPPGARPGSDRRGAGGIVRTRRGVVALRTTDAQMNGKYHDMEFRRNDDASRYELLDGDTVVAIADYVERLDAVVMPHTVVDPSRRGQGLGAQIVRQALDDVRGSGRKVVPTCWYVAEFIDSNPDYADLRAG